MKHASQGIATSLYNTVNNVSRTFGVAISALLLSAARKGGSTAHLESGNFLALYMVLAGCCLLAALLATRNLAQSLRRPDQGS